MGKKLFDPHKKRLSLGFREKHNKFTSKSVNGKPPTIFAKRYDRGR
jgi:hypothetical protein